MCWTLNEFEHFLNFISAVSECVSISAFHSLIGVFVGITSAVTARIKEYEPIIKNNKKKGDKTVWLAKTKLNGYVKAWPGRFN